MDIPEEHDDESHGSRVRDGRAPVVSCEILMLPTILVLDTSPEIVAVSFQLLLFPALKDDDHKNEAYTFFAYAHVSMHTELRDQP